MCADLGIPARPTDRATAVWTAGRGDGSAFADYSNQAPREASAGWMPLGQHWAGQPALKTNPGWTCITWSPAGLTYEFFFVETRPRNRAVRLNELTYKLGDVMEIFLQPAGSDRYLEIHVTPENQRLQLSWPPGAVEAVTAGRTQIADYLHADSNWVASEVCVSAKHWSGRVVIPRSTLGLGSAPLDPAMEFSTAVCRYDCSVRGVPVLSSTAKLTKPSFHRREEWHRLRLAEAGGN